MGIWKKFQTAFNLIEQKFKIEEITNIAEKLNNRTESEYLLMHYMPEKIGYMLDDSVLLQKVIIELSESRLSINTHTTQIAATEFLLRYFGNASMSNSKLSDVLSLSSFPRKLVAKCPNENCLCITRKQYIANRKKFTQLIRKIRRMLDRIGIESARQIYLLAKET